MQPALPPRPPPLRRPPLGLAQCAAFPFPALSNSHPFVRTSACPANVPAVQISTGRPYPARGQPMATTHVVPLSNIRHWRTTTHPTPRDRLASARTGLLLSSPRPARRSSPAMSSKPRARPASPAAPSTAPPRPQRPGSRRRQQPLRSRQAMCDNCFPQKTPSPAICVCTATATVAAPWRSPYPSGMFITRPFPTTPDTPACL